MLVVQLILCAVLSLVGARLMLIGARALRGGLPRDQRMGVRTATTMSSDAAFELGNRAAAPAIVASGGVALLSGVSLPMLASGLSVAVVATLGFLGGFGLLGVASLVGNRAAAAMPASAGGCGGCGGGCCCG